VSASAIELTQLTLRRGGRTVLSGVDAVIAEGEFVGVFGPNGAGKTTLLQALLGLLRPQSGAISIFGKPPLHGNPLAGYMPQRRAAMAELRLTGWDVVASALDGHRWGLPILGAEGRRQVAWALETVEAAEFKGCCWRRRCWGSPGCCCSTNRSSASTRAISRPWSIW
jgi:zinc/manganese transport system ATP-binding protein